MPKPATSLNDFVDDKPLVFSKEDIKEGVQKFIKSFGSFNRTGLHRFYEKAGIATIAWEQKNTIDGSVEPLRYGKVVAVVPENVSKGTKVWKKYEAKSDSLFLFWEEFYRQANVLIAKEEYGEKQRMLELEEIGRQIGII